MAAPREENNGLEAFCRQAVERIAKLMRSGLTIGPDVMHFAASTFGLHSVEEMQAVIDEEDSDAREAIIELILFPDVVMQEKLETLLSRHALGPKEQEAVIQGLLCEVPLVMASVPGKDCPLRIPVEYETMARLVTRFNMEWTMDHELSRAIEVFLPEKQRCPVRVKLRNLPADFTPESIRFLCRFLETFPFGAVDFEECFDYALGLVGEIGPEVPPPLLMQKKRKRLKELLWQAQRFEQELAVNNMETMMLRGMRPQAVGSEDIKKEIGLIDRIGNAVYGPLCIAEAPRKTLHIESGSEKRDLHKIIDFLS